MVYYFLSLRQQLKTAQQAVENYFKKVVDKKQRNMIN